MKIGVISDTHIPRAATELPGRIYSEFKNCDLILHAGDLVELSVLDKLKAVAAVKAVYGNMDDRKVRQALPEKEVIDIKGKFKIGMIHGRGAPTNLIKTVAGEFNNVDVIVFGHSHSPVNKRINGVLFFNPGSPTDKVFAAYNSFGILEVNNEIKGRIIKL